MKHIIESIEYFIQKLPTELFNEALKLKHKMTADFVTSGHFYDLAQLELFPLLNLHQYALDSFSEKQRGEIFEQGLLGNYYALMTIYLQKQMRDINSQYDQKANALSQLFHQQAFIHYRNLSDHPEYLDQIQQCWLEHTDASTREGGDSLQSISQKIAPLKLPLLAIYYLKDANPDTLHEILNRLFAVVVLNEELLSFRYDFKNQTSGYLLLKVFQLTGLDWKSDPNTLLGSALLSGVFQKVCEEGLTLLEESLPLMSELALDWQPFVTSLKTRLIEFKQLLTLSGFSKLNQTTLYFIHPMNSLEQSLASAKRYLLDDLNFRECWEFQNSTLKPNEMIISNTFTVGFLLEQLMHSGHVLPQLISDCLQRYIDANYCYYDQLDFPPDTDSLGLFLRLFPHSLQLPEHQEALQLTIPWLKANIFEDGELPVYLIDGIPFELDESSVYWGSRCIGVEINALLGLLALNREALDEELVAIFLTALQGVFQRLIEGKITPLSNYHPEYVLWNAVTLYNQLKAHSVYSHQLPLDDYQVALATLLNERSQTVSSSQHIALMILANLALDPSYTCPESWLRHLLKQQSFQGFWEAEPLYPTPARVYQVTWYSSRLVTTSLCYRALKQF